MFPQPKPASQRCRRAAFTLVELLVVIGIIALRIGILMPALSRARERANATKCLSNLRQIGLMFRAYAEDNKGSLPWSAKTSGANDMDFIYWQTNRDINQSRLTPYMGKTFNRQLFICPSDNLEVRSYNIGGGYRFSYSMNSLMSGYKLTRIKNSAQKVVVMEEDETSIDDANSSLQQDSYIDLLAIRHDPRKAPERESDPLTVKLGAQNGNMRGNVTFADGHSEAITRLQCHSPEYYDPAR